MGEIGEHLCKVETEDDNLFLLFRKVSEESNEFDLDVTDGLTVWSTRVTDELLQNMATKVEMDVKDYAMQTFKALTCHSSGNDCFVYQAIEKNSMLEFNWKRQLADGVKYQLGSISLSLNQENKELMQKILNVAVGKIHEYKDNTAFMKSENEHLAKDYETAITRLGKCVDSKEEMELDLFKKFVTVLNDKKAKIRRLQEVIEQQSKQLPAQTEDSNVSHGSATDDSRNNQRKRDDDTDVESEQSQSNVKLIPVNQSAATTSNIASSLFQDEEDTQPVVKRRSRKKQSKQATPSKKSVLPEVKAAVKRTVSNASSDSTISNESRQSSNLTRRRSRRKKDSSTFPDDVEDLFGDMA